MNQPYPPPPKPFSWRKWAIWTTAAAAASFGIFGAIGAATRHDTAGPEACKAALNRAYDQGTALNTWPPACLGLDQPTRERLIGEIAQKELGESLSNVWKNLETAQP